MNIMRIVKIQTLFLKMHLVQAIQVVKQTPKMTVMEKTMNQIVNPLMMIIHTRT